MLVRFVWYERREGGRGESRALLHRRKELFSYPVFLMCWGGGRRELGGDEGEKDRSRQS